MDSIYDDLENYNNVNEAEELKVANEELKLKLEEHNATIRRLQRDFDKLASDYKNLELNYSSLLKTAKAEIERKTQAIIMLNQEKDKLVLSSIQNSNMGYSILTRNFPNNRKSKIEDASPARNNRIQELKKREPDKMRNDENRQPSTETVTSRNSDDVDKTDKSEAKSKIDANDKNKESKEGKAKKALSLKNRRKSMPVLNKHHMQFSTDEEYDGNCSEEIPQRDWSREDKRRYSERHKQSHKISETSGIDEKYSSYHESSRDTYYKNKLCRQSDKYRARDRHQRHFSPEKLRSSTRDTHNDPRQEFMRHRVLVSPPKDSYPLRRFYEKQNFDRDSSNEERGDDYQERRHAPRDVYRDMSRSDYRDPRLSRKDNHDERQGVNYEKKIRSESKEDLRVSLLDKRRNRNFSPEDRHVKRGVSREEKHSIINKSHEDRLRNRDDSLERRPKRTNKKLHRASSDIDEPTSKRPRLDSESPPTNLVIELPEEISSTDRMPEEASADVVNMRPEEMPTSKIAPTDVVSSRPEEKPTEKRISTDKESLGPEKMQTSKNMSSAQTMPTVEKKPTAENSKIAEHMPTVRRMQHAHENLPPEFEDHLQPSSCQSPDNIHYDVATALPKTIKSTSSTIGEDPRLTSKKYVKGINGNQVVLSSKTGRDIELKAIDKSTWNIAGVEIPAALTKPPDDTIRDVQDLYMDVENPVSNMSLESGEIQSESNDTKMMDYVNKNFFQDYENERINLIDARAEKRHSRDPRFVRDMPKNNNVEIISNKVEEPPVIERKLPPVKYKIPRLSTSETKPTPAPHPLETLLKQYESTSGLQPTIKPPEAKLDVDETFGPDNDTKIKAKDKEGKPKKARNQRDQKKVSATEMIENDLALSDEPSDKITTRRRKKSDRACTKRQQEKKLNGKALKDEELQDQNNLKETAKHLPVEEQPMQTNICASNKESEKQVLEVSHQKSEVVSTQTGDDSPEVQLNVKNPKKTKKKATSKTKATVVKEDLNYANTAEIPIKKTRVRKSKSPKVSDENKRKPKFSDLFGDSSSLITPEDLGMATESQPKSTVGKYIPLFEDAQDSVDVNVNASRQKETQLLIENSPVSVLPKVDETPAIVLAKSTKSLITKIILPKSSAMTELTKKNESATESVQNLTPSVEVSSAVTRELDVVKTVIISTGIQPQIDDIQKQINTADIGVNTEKTASTTLSHIPVIPVALATSTPHKRLLHQLEAEAPSSSNTSTRNTSSGEQTTTSNGLPSETPNDDVPDVRIFVKRRRRLKK